MAETRLEGARYVLSIRERQEIYIQPVPPVREDGLEGNEVRAGNVRRREVALKEKLLKLGGRCPCGLVWKDGVVELNGIIGLW